MTSHVARVFLCSSLNIALKGELFLNFLTFRDRPYAFSPFDLYMARACVVALMVFGMNFHIAKEWMMISFLVFSFLAL